MRAKQERHVEGHRRWHATDIRNSPAGRRPSHPRSAAGSIRWRDDVDGAGSLPTGLAQAHSTAAVLGRVSEACSTVCRSEVPSGATTRVRILSDRGHLSAGRAAAGSTQTSSPGQQPAVDRDRGSREELSVRGAQPEHEPRHVFGRRQPVKCEPAGD